MSQMHKFYKIFFIFSYKLIYLIQGVEQSNKLE